MNNEYYVVVDKRGRYWGANGGMWRKEIGKAIFYKSLRMAKETAERFKYEDAQIKKVSIVEEDDFNETD